MTQPPPPARKPPTRLRRLLNDLAFATRPQAGFGQKPGLGRVLRTFAVAGIPSMRHLDMPRRLHQLSKLGFNPGTIYDIGAASGDWARLAHMIWPSATIIGFEPNARCIPDLDRTKAQVPGFRYYRGFLGPSSGEVRYSDQQEQTSLYFKESDAAPAATAPMLVLDELIARGEIPPPDFMKLDVQGFELEVLKGGRKALDSCQAAVLEVTFIPFLDGVPLALEVAAFMDQQGFAWHDVMGIYRRASDDALVQMDVLFLRKDHPMRRAGLE